MALPWFGKKTLITLIWPLTDTHISPPSYDWHSSFNWHVRVSASGTNPRPYSPRWGCCHYPLPHQLLRLLFQFLLFGRTFSTYLQHKPHLTQFHLIHLKFRDPSLCVPLESKMDPSSGCHVFWTTVYLITCCGAIPCLQLLILLSYGDGFCQTRLYSIFCYAGLYPVPGIYPLLFFLAV